MILLNSTIQKDHTISKICSIISKKVEVYRDYLIDDASNSFVLWDSDFKHIIQQVPIYTVIDVDEMRIRVVEELSKKYIANIDKSSKTIKIRLKT